jgi:hypothetical protein
VCPVNSYLTKISRPRHKDRQNSVVREMMVAYSENLMKHILCCVGELRGFFKVVEGLRL